MNKRILWAALTGLMVPYVGTLAWTGTIRGEELHYEQQKEVSGRRRILLDRSSGSYYMDIEEYVPGVIARQMRVDYEPEALKEQAKYLSAISPSVNSSGGVAGNPAIFSCCSSINPCALFLHACAVSTTIIGFL